MVFDIFEKLEKISSRNEMTDVLSGFFKGLDGESAQIYAYLLQGRVCPLFVDREFNFSEISALKVLESICILRGLNLNVYQLRDELGDAGLVAERVFTSLNSMSSYTIRELYDSLWSLILYEGKDSVKYKSNKLAELLNKSDSIDAKYLIRLISGKLRLGCSDKTLLDAFSFLLSGSKDARDGLSRVYGTMSDLGHIAGLVVGKEAEDKKLSHILSLGIVPGVPIFPQLVERVAGFDEAVERFPEGCYLQPKFDGLRSQAHLGVSYSGSYYVETIWSKYVQKEQGLGLFGEEISSDNIRVFSRNLNDITEMFPEIVEEFVQLGLESCILDGEVVGWDNDLGKFLPFQDTMTRKRKYDIKEHSSTVPVKYFVFDILYLNGQDLTLMSLDERMKILQSILKNRSGNILLSDSIEVKDRVEIEDLFDKYVAEGLEGVILKRKNSVYLAGVRNFEWIKLKKTIENKVVDSIDAVVIGYYYGSGKQVEFGMGALLLGVYNEEKDRFESVGKVGTGITEEMWGKISTRIKPLQVKSRPSSVLSVDRTLEPDIWVSPEVVVTVDADEITKSSVHSAGEEELGFGLSLRFPRLVDFDRDKKPEDATHVKEMIDLWSMKIGKA